MIGVWCMVYDVGGSRLEYGDMVIGRGLMSCIRDGEFPEDGQVCRVHYTGTVRARRPLLVRLRVER